MSVFNKSGRVHAPDAKYTGEEPDWHGWEKWPIDKFYRTRQRALGFYTYYLDVASMKPIVLAWMKREGYSKDDVDTVREAPPWYLSGTVGKLVRMLDRGMPSIHPDAHEHFSKLEQYDPDIPLVPKDDKETVKSEIKRSLAVIRNERKAVKVDDSGNVVAEPKKKVTPLDRIKEKVDKEILFHIDQLIDQWAYPTKGIATINLGNMLRDNKVPAQGCGPILHWIEKNLEEYSGALYKTDAQLVEGYSYLTKAQLKKIVQVLETMKSDLETHAKIKKSNRKPRVKKPKAADKQVSRLKYQASSAEYSVDSLSPSRIPYSQRLYIFNTKTRQLGVYFANGNAGFTVQGTSIKGYDPEASFHATLRKPQDVLTGILAATPKKLDKIFDGVKITRKKANGRFNEHTIILKVLEHRP